MGKLVRFVAGAAVGAAVGLAGAVLYAPDSGKQLQARLEERRRLALAAGKAEMEARERELNEELRARIETKEIKRQALKG